MANEKPVEVVKPATVEAPKPAEEVADLEQIAVKLKEIKTRAVAVSTQRVINMLDNFLGTLEAKNNEKKD